MDNRKRNRIIIFLIAPFLASFLFFAEDTLFRIIIIALLIIYVAFLIFLRDSIKFEGPYVAKSSPENDEKIPEEPQQEFDESFKIVSKNRDIEIITADNYIPEHAHSKITLKPPDLKERFEEIANESLPDGIGHDGQFTFVLEKILTVIKEAFHANTAIFFWYNKKKEKLSIERFVSNSNEIERRKFDIEDDILSKIVQLGEPELLSDISPAAEADVIRYYTSAQGIRSFVGVPLFYDKQLIAIIALDSKIGDMFGIETIYALGRFVRVLTMIITIFEEKHSDSISQQRLKGLLNLIAQNQKFESAEDLISSLQNSMSFLLPWDAFAFIFYHPLSQKFKTFKIINNTSLKYVGENLDIELNGTLVGKSIITGIPIKIDDTSSGNFIRFSKVESVSFDGSFLAIPVVYNSQNYGVLCFESLKKNVYTNQDVQFLKSAVNIFSYIIYSYSTQTLLKSFLALDIETKTLNAETFKERLTSDLYKASQLKIPGALALIKIDDFLEQESLFDGNPFPRVLTAVSETISEEMTPFNILGRLSEKVFAVYFFNANTKDVFLWAEKLRVKIARKPIAVVSKQTTYTVSIGVASANGKVNADEIIFNADLALQKALEKGGNTVRNIN
ncbi:MAG TPA: GAF domain-containing protein [Ignavibacteriaceae bacterium]|nr:GAF domain-containing protein [Ignavibacteriaceae bacterium]